MAPNLKKAARELAAKGRYGDTMLLHVSKDEVRGLASLLADGKLPTNPVTGLPEAWFFLPFLASLFGGAAAAAAPVAAAGTAAAGAAAAAAPALAGAAAAAAPSLAAGAGMAGLTAAGAAGAHGLAAAAPVLGGLSGAAAAAPAIGAGGGFLGGLGSAVKGIGSGISSLFGGGAPAAAGTAGAGTPAATGLGGFMSKNMMPLMIGSQLLSPLFNKGGGGSKEEEGPSDEDVEGMQYEGGDPVFPKSGEGGKGEWNFFPKRHAAGGLVRGYAGGGIIELAEGGDVSQQMDIQAQQPQDMSFPLNGVPATPEVGEVDIGMEEDIPESPFPKSQIGEGEEALAGDQEQELIAQTVAVIKGMSPNPKPIILAFINTFGEDALKDLVTRVRSTEGPPKSPGGDGMSDSVPAMIDGQQPAALSQGEYVMPADVVSGLGNGSTDAGAQQLDQMAAGIRQQRTGSPQQPPAMNAGGLVRQYAGGGIVSLDMPRYAEGGRVRSSRMPMPEITFNVGLSPTLENGEYAPLVDPDRSRFPPDMLEALGLGTARVK